MSDRFTPRLGRRTLLMALPLTAVSAAALSACGADSKAIPVADVVEHYRQVTAELFAAMDTVRELGWGEDGALTLQPPDHCATEPGEYNPGYWAATSPLYLEPGQGMDWEPWRAVLDPVLTQRGFEKLGREKRQGAAYGISAKDVHGATLTLYDKGELQILGAKVVGDGCG